MLNTFPTCLFSFATREIAIRQNVISGGLALDGTDTVIATDGGGRWVAQYGNAPLNNRNKVMAWRAARAILDGGVVPIIFPICDARHQPVLGSKGVPHSDGAPFSDESLYSGGDNSVHAAVDTPLRSTSMALNISGLAKPLIGGERFSIDHPTWRHRLYEIKTISGPQITFRPPLREAVAVGTEFNFSDPHCVMRLAAESDMAAPLNGPRTATGSITLVEDFTGAYT